MLELGRQIFLNGTHAGIFCYLERLTGRIFGPWSAGTAWRVLHVLEALAFNQGSLSSSQYTGTFLCGNAPPIKTTCAQVSSTEPVVKLLQYSTSLSSLNYSLAFLHQWEGSQASMSRSCMQNLSCCPAHIKNLHILLIFSNLSLKQLLLVFFLSFKAARKSSCCSFLSDLISQLRVHFQLSSDLTFDLEIGVKNWGQRKKSEATAHFVARKTEKTVKLFLFRSITNSNKLNAQAWTDILHEKQFHPFGTWFLL